MLKLKRKLAWLIVLVMLASVMPMTLVSAEGEDVETQSGITRIGVLSDTHINTDVGTNGLKRALQRFSDIDPDYAGLVLTGDIVIQVGDASNNFEVYEEPYYVVKNVLSTYAVDSKGNPTPYFWSMGNHEMPHACVQKVAQSEEQLGYMQTAIATSKNYYVKHTGMQLHDDKVIGGYHFITADQIDGSNVMDADGEAYMKAQIEAALAEPGGDKKPIFLSLHKSPWGTTVGSTVTAYDNPYTKEFTDYLATVPNVIILTGHTHASECRPQSIWQDGGYTVINLGHVSNGGDPMSEGVMLEINENDVVTVKRVDFINGEYIGEDWVIDIPNMVDHSSTDDAEYATYWKYTDERANNSLTPEFAQDAEVTATAITEVGAKITFPQATGYENVDDNLITKYRIKVINKNLQTLVQDYTVDSQYYQPPSLREETLSESITSLNAGMEYSVEVSAITAWGKESESITGSFTTAAATEDDTEEITVNSPEDDPRNPIYKYVVAKDESGKLCPNYKDVYSPGRNRKEVQADEEGKYPEGSFTATVKVDGVDVEKHYIDSFTTDSRFGYGGGYLTFYESGNYVSFDFTVEEPGRYELMGIAANRNSSDMSVYIDGQKKGNFNIPVNNNGAYGPLYDGTYATAGEYLLEAGTYEIMFKLDAQANGQIAFYGAALAKQADAVIIKRDYTESTTLVHDNNCAMYPNGNPPHALVYENRKVSFDVTAPMDGIYDVYGVIGTSKKHDFKVEVDGIECFTDTVTDALAFRKLNGKIPLTAGKHTLSIVTGESSDPFSFFAISEIMIVKEGAKSDWTWKRINYNDKNTEITTNHANGLLDGVAFGMGSGCYAEYTITPSVTGTYSISHFMAANSAEITFSVNGEVVSNFVHNTNDSAVMTKATTTEEVNVVLVKDMTYDILLSKTGGGSATVVYTDIVLESEITTPEGLFYDIYAGDSVADNYASQGADTLKYGNGRKNSGWGCYGGLYSEFNFSIEHRGWYNLNLVLGATAASVVTVLIDGTEVATKNTAFVEGEGWSVKRDNDFGEVFLFEGDHTLKILGVDESFQIFKTRISYDRADDGKTAMEFVYDCIDDRTSKGGPNCPDYTSPYNGMVLGERSSYAEFTVDVPAGNYILSICYGSKAFDGRIDLTVNGGVLGTYTLPQNNTWIYGEGYDRNAYYSPEILSLNDGINTIKIATAKKKDSTDWAYFSFTSLKLTKVVEPEVLMYSGKYITPDGKIEALADGTVTLRNYLPAYMEGEKVTVIACIYENGRLYKVDTTDKASATVNDIIISQFEDISMTDGKTYTLKTFYIDEIGSMKPLCESVPVI